MHLVYKTGHARFQASATNYMRTVLFRAMTQGAVKFRYRRFGTTYRFHFHLETVVGKNNKY